MHRHLTIHILSEWGPEWRSRTYDAIPLNNKRTRHFLDAHSTLYENTEVTGINWVVQAVLLTQNSCYTALKDAVFRIENSRRWQSHAQFAFACSHATHRSVGCAVLLATFFYKDARIRFTTRRTIRAAREFGMVPCPEL